ncbi:hypothetical protein ACR77V_12965, partial [Staphylococcus epidermidis]|uniref:hypothetical protein n=1 Tax=Staphylococcus epidermidis TaxID=1282 RepID=UPI003DA337AA
MNMYGYKFYTEQDLLHYGLKGMHWGTRRWQNEDGTFNSAGKERYFGRGTGEDYHPVKSGSQKTVSKSVTRTKTVTKTSNSGDRLKKVAKGAAIAGGVALAAYGAYKVSQIDPAVLAKYKQTATLVLNTASSGAKKAYN